MFESLLDFVTMHKTLFLYLFIIMMVVLLVYIYVKKYFVLNRESETVQLKDEFLQLRTDINKLKQENQLLNNKLNNVNTRARYGEISNGQLPFTRECMENTPFYTIIGSQFLNNIDDDLTPTNRQMDNYSLSQNPNNHLVEEMSEPDDTIVTPKREDPVVYPETDDDIKEQLGEHLDKSLKSTTSNEVIVNNERESTVSQTTLNSFISKDLVLDKITNPNISKMTTSVVLNPESLIKNKKKLTLTKKNQTT